MSWLFSRALVEEFLEANCLGGARSVLLSGTPMPHGFSHSAKTTDRFQPSRYGMTLARLTEDLGAELLTWFRGASPAKSTAAHLEGAAWRKTSGRSNCGSWQMPLHGLSLPRTSHARPSTQRPTTSKRWVTKCDALPYRRQTWALTTFGSGIGYLHTPTHTANYACRSMQKWPNCREYVRVFGKPTPTNHEWLMGWPIGWTGLQPLGTDRFRAWQQQHSARSDTQLFSATETAKSLERIPS